MEQRRFGELYDTALAAWPESRQREVKAAYYRNLDGLSDPTLEAAFNWVGRNWTRDRGMPTAGDIRQQAERIARESTETHKREPVTHTARTIMAAGIQNALAHNGWHPETTAEREGAWLFSELLAARDGVRFASRENGKTVNTWPKLQGAALRAFTDFGGKEALRLVDAETVLLARETFAKSYAKHVDMETP